MNVAKTTPPQAAEERRAEGVCQIEARFCSMIEPMVVGEGHETPKPGLAPGLSTAKPEARPPPTDRAVDRDRQYTLDPIHKNLTIKSLTACTEYRRVNQSYFILQIPSIRRSPRYNT